MAPAKCLQLITVLERIHATEDDVARRENIGSRLPPDPLAQHPGVGLQPFDYPAGDFELFAANIHKPSTNQAVKVGVLRSLRIEHGIVLEANVRCLLDDVRAAATKSDNADQCALDYGLTSFAEERLPLISRVHKNSSLAETTLMLLSFSNRRRPGTANSPHAWVLLRMIKP